MQKPDQHGFIHIAVTPENYEKLKDAGRAGDSFNDVITKLLLMWRNKK